MAVNTNSLEELITIGKNLLAAGLVIGTWGNISCFLPQEELVVITPSGMDYDSLTLDDLVFVNLQGQIVKGQRKPSSETELHLELYRTRKDVQAVIHTHSIHATAVAVARVEIPPLTEDMVQLLGGAVKTARYAPAGSKELAVEAVQALGELNAVLLANHGMVGVGRDLKEAMNVCLMVEKGAQIFIQSKLLGHVQVIPDAEVKAMRQFFLTNYGQK